ncbi:hypothetical protein FE784_15875 [Paenibacillus hemerocallicola]|uniref:DUF916 domain-containing protein n=1 Tax=Paenibacillus hemerocallicola TaxID=1172614 RepID=A0A5C4TA39_9BACL|nr:hypothetical protein [Paenibacillus hemerocallicola]TNJ65297.1 hypothetical protein FE784_15875 [Paenibacillus hemerocallicola]
MMWIRLLLLATVFCVATGFSAPAEGQQLIVSGDPARIQPQLGAYMEEIVPGDEREYTVEVTNPTDKDITALLYTADAVPALGGGKDFTLPDDPELGSSAWYKTPDRPITLRAGETQSYTVNMRIPEHVEPGQYVSVIGVYDDQGPTLAASDNEQTQFVTRMVRKTGLQVVLSYKLDEAKPPQAIPNSVTYGLENGRGFLSILLMNEGGSLSKPEMTVQVKRQGEDKSVLELEARFDSIYAGTVAQHRAELSRPLAAGAYLAEVITTVNGRTEQKELPFGVADEAQRTHWGTASSGEIIEVAEDGSPLPSPWLGSSRIYVYAGLLLLLGIVTWRRRRADRGRSKESR